MRVFTDHRLIIESEKSNIEMQISFYSKNPITGFFCFERRSDMTYHEFCGGFCQFIMRRFSELTCFMPELYEMFSKEDMPPEEFALRSFCGPFYEEPKKKQLRASDFREMLPDDRKLLFDEELMSFAMGNCITLEDTNGNRKLLKRRYEEKIDNVSALMDAFIAYKLNKDAFE